LGRRPATRRAPALESAASWRDRFAGASRNASETRPPVAKHEESDHLSPRAAEAGQVGPADASFGPADRPRWPLPAAPISARLIKSASRLVVLDGSSRVRCFLTGAVADGHARNGQVRAVRGVDTNSLATARCS
jgi:hypothetical protein